MRLLEILLALDRWRDEKERLPLGKNPRRLVAMTKILPTARDPYAKLIDEAEFQLQELVGSDHYFDYSVSVVGSGDFISGTGRRLKERNPDTKIIAVEPAESPGLSALRAGEVLHQERMVHNMYGAIPFNLPADKLNIDFGVIDEIEQVTVEEWQDAEKRLHEQEEQLVGRSSSAEFSVALRLAQQVHDANILITFHAPAWKYTDTYVPAGYKA